MIGNDIVDLEASRRESNWRRRGFLEKIFTEEERKLILQSSYPEKQVWLFWSMKEAAYKAHQRNFNLPRRYSPKSYNCTINSSDETKASGKVQYENWIYYTKTILTPEYIHTTASFSTEEKIISTILPSSEDLKKHFISHYASLTNSCISTISLTKDSRFIPRIIFGKQPVNCSFSLSHHQKFSAYALALTNY